MKTKTTTKTTVKLTTATKTLLVGGALLLAAAGLQTGAFSKESKQQYKIDIEKLQSLNKEKPKKNEYLSEKEREKRNQIELKNQKERPTKRPRNSWPENPGSWELRPTNWKVFPTCKRIPLAKLMTEQIDFGQNYMPVANTTNAILAPQYIDYDNLTEEIIKETQEVIGVNEKIISKSITRFLPPNIVDSVDIQEVNIAGANWEADWSTTGAVMGEVAMDTTMQTRAQGDMYILADAELTDGRVLRIRLAFDELKTRSIITSSYNGSTGFKEANLLNKTDVLIGQGSELFKGQAFKEGKLMVYLETGSIQTIEMQRKLSDGTLVEITDPILLGAIEIALERLKETDYSISATVLMTEYTEVDNLLSNILDMVSILYSRWIAIEASPYTNNENIYIKWTEMYTYDGSYAYLCDDGQTKKSSKNPFNEKPKYRIENSQYIQEQGGNSSLPRE